MLLSKEMRGALDDQLPLQKSYDEALKKVAPKGSEGLYRKRDIEKAQNAIRDLAILADSFNLQNYASVFVTKDFITLVKSLLGANVIENERKRLDAEMAKVREKMADLAGWYGWIEAILRGSYLDIELKMNSADIGKSQKEAAAEIKATYDQKLAILEKDQEKISSQFRNLKTPINAGKAQLASIIIRLCLTQCQEQYAQVQPNAELLKLINEPLENAIRVLNGVVIAGLNEKKV